MDTITIARKNLYKTAVDAIIVAAGTGWTGSGLESVLKSLQTGEYIDIRSLEVVK